MLSSQMPTRPVLGDKAYLVDISVDAKTSRVNTVSTKHVIYTEVSNGDGAKSQEWRTIRSSEGIYDINGCYRP